MVIEKHAGVLRDLRGNTVHATATRHIGKIMDADEVDSR